MSDIARVVTRILRETLPEATFIALHEPRFAGNEWTYVKECIDTGWVSSAGKYVDRFERDLAEFTGAAHAVAVANGTVALHMALSLVGVTRGDEVLIPALTFVATANAVSYCGAVPHFVDSEDATLSMDPRALRDHLRGISLMRAGECWNRLTQRRIRAVVPMHTFGHPADIRGLLQVAEEFRLELVEDAAESLGSYYGDQHTGTFGRLGILSFNGNKTVTTGGGGAILIDDPELARRAKHVTTTAKVPHQWEYFHDEVGYNYRLPNINAALGCAQLEQMPKFLASKRRLYETYEEAFLRLPLVRLVSEPPGCRSNYWLQALVIPDAPEGTRDEVLRETNQAGFMTRPTWTLLHKLPMYQGCPRAPLPVAERLERTLINIPSSAGLA